MTLFTLAELEAAAVLVNRTVPPTPQFAWPLLAARVGTEVWVKHENHTPIGAFKVRGGLVYVDHLMRSATPPKGIISATRGNHGQSLAFAAKRAGLECVICVPRGNSVEKNAAMRAFGAELIEHGADFDEAKAEADRVSRVRGLHFVPSFHKDLVMGVATYALELFRAVRDLDQVYCPIGLGSGISGLITVRDLLGLKTEVIGVVSDGADAYARSFEAGRVIATERAQTFADGMAVRVPDPAAYALIAEGAAAIVRVSDAEVAAAIRAYYADTHNLAEGAGAAALAAAMADGARVSGRRRGKRIAVVLSGGNIDAAVFGKVLAQQVPEI